MEFVDRETGEVISRKSPAKRRKRVGKGFDIIRKPTAREIEDEDAQFPDTKKEAEKKSAYRPAPYREWMTLAHTSAEYLSLVMDKEIPAPALVFWFRLIPLVEQGNKIDLTQTQIGARIGISQQMTSRWIRLFINKGFIYKHGYYYRIPPDFMYCGAWAKILDAKNPHARPLG
jgi:hypothetical protein